MSTIVLHVVRLTDSGVLKGVFVRETHSPCFLRCAVTVGISKSSAWLRDRARIRWSRGLSRSRWDGLCKRHGEHLGLQLLLKLGGIVTAVLDSWLYQYMQQSRGYFPLQAQLFSVSTGVLTIEARSP